VNLRKDLPSTDQSNKSKSTSDLQQLENVCEIGFGSRRRNSGVGCGDEREQHDEAEEEEHEQHVDAQSADQVMLWNICEELYGAPFAPPSAVKADVIWVMGSWLYAREHQWVP
jgi:hypothetical protein